MMTIAAEGPLVVRRTEGAEMNRDTASTITTKTKTIAGIRETRAMSALTSTARKGATVITRPAK